MNVKTVLSKIANLLSTEEVNLAYAKLKDGTVVESPTFDVGEDLFVVSEDGSKTPAPDGEHELSLKDTEGNDVLIKVIAKDGKIVERENVELEETITAEPMPGDEPTELEETPIEEVVSPVDDASIEMGKVIETLSYRIAELEKRMDKMAEVEIEVSPDEEEEDLPKLDGAPVEPKTMLSASKVNFGKKVTSTHERVLERMYNIQK